MRQWRRVVAAVAALGSLLTLPACGQSSPPALQRGSRLAAIVGQTVAGKTLTLPDAVRGDPAVIVFSFSRAGGQDAQRWTQRLQQEGMQPSVYLVIFLETVPQLFRPLAVSGIAKGIPPSLRDRTLLVYRDQSFWEQALRVTDRSSATVVVCGADGRVREILAGPYSESGYHLLIGGVRSAP